MKDWQKVRFFSILPLILIKLCSFFSDNEKMGISFESLLYPTFSAKCRNYVDFEQRDSHGELRNRHGKFRGTKLQSLWEHWRKILKLLDFLEA